MAIYVDFPCWPKRRLVYGHMMTNGDIRELHDFAARLGLKRAWFQNKPGHPHYDVSIGQYYKAIRFGAIAVTSKELVRICVRKEGHHGEGKSITDH